METSDLHLVVSVVLVLISVPLGEDFQEGLDAHFYALHLLHEAACLNLWAKKSQKVQVLKDVLQSLHRCVARPGVQDKLPTKSDQVKRKTRQPEARPPSFYFLTHKSYSPFEGSHNSWKYGDFYSDLSGMKVGGWKEKKTFFVSIGENNSYNIGI